jgi:hypothetical protein
VGNAELDLRLERADGATLVTATRNASDVAIRIEQ